MAHFGCPTCSKTVESGWKACPHCGASIEGVQKTPGRMTGGRLTFLAIAISAFVFLALVMAAIVAVMPSSTPSERARSEASGIPTPVTRTPIVGVDPDDADLVKRSKSLVSEAERLKVIARWSCVGNEAYVREVLWAQFNIDQKRGIARALAVSCHSQKSGRRMTIKGYQSGRTLARFSGDDISVE